MSFKPAQGSLRVKDIDAPKRTVVFYASAFNKLDSDGDIILPGAFRKTITERGPAGTKRIKHLLQHSPIDIVGGIQAMEEDSYGLLVESKLLDTDKGRDTLKLYEADLFEHSIGFRTVKGEPDERQNAYLIREVMLWEVSAVTWGANEFTPLVSMKSADKAHLLHNSLTKLIAALRKGSYTDETFQLLEDHAAAIQKQYETLVTDSKPEPTSTTAPQPDEQKAILQFLDKFSLSLT